MCGECLHIITCDCCLFFQVKTVAKQLLNEKEGPLALMTKTIPCLAQNYFTFATVLHSVAVLYCKQKAHILLPFNTMLLQPSSLAVSFCVLINHFSHGKIYSSEMLSTYNAGWFVGREYPCHSWIRKVIWYVCVGYVNIYIFTAYLPSLTECINGHPVFVNEVRLQIENYWSM